jgi:hypothetical protein
MRQWKPLCAGTLAAALLGTTAAADMTADQVWQDWQALSTSMGQSMVAGSTDASNGTLTVNDITITSAEDEVTVTGTIDQIVFHERGDGTVEITMSESYPLTIVAPGEMGEPVTMTMELTQSGLVMVASGSEGEVTYDLTADEVRVALAELSSGEDMPSVDMSVAMATVSGRYQVWDSQDFSTGLQAATMTVNIAADELDDGTSFTADLSLADIEMTSALAGLNLTEMEEVGAAIRAGFGVRVDMTHGAAEFSATGADEFSGQTAIAGTLGSGGLGMSMDDDGLRYATTARDIDMTFASDEMPFPPLSVAMAESTLSFQMPLLAGEEAQEFSLETRLVDLAVDDMLWGMFDPGNVLPRDPATAIIAIGGTLRLIADLMDAPDSPTGTVPAEPVDLTLRELQLTVAGAELTGDGAFTFDNTDLITFDGMPRPEGAVNLRLVGGNGLIDKLVQLGYLPPDQAMGARMMMGLFGRPGDGDDTLTSTIEVRDDGGIYANGQRIQ